MDARESFMCLSAIILKRNKNSLERKLDMNKSKSERIIYNKLETISKFIDKPLSKFSSVDLEAIREDVQIALSEVQLMMSQDTKYKLICDEADVEIRGFKRFDGTYSIAPGLLKFGLTDNETDEFTLAEIEQMQFDNPYYNWDMFRMEIADDTFRD